MPRLVFDRYEIVKRLAVGGMGEVFLARQGVAGLDRLVILKNLLPQLANEPGFVEQFLDEARVASTLNHPNIVAIYEVGLWDGTYYLAMEYIRGANLSRLLRAASASDVTLPFPVAARVIHDAALGLDHAHRATDDLGRPLGIVHRDVSPQNIMVRIDGVTKVVDFGIAKATNRATRTETGVLKGKIPYMSPEQTTAAALDGRSDQFSLGVVLWELSTQRRLFRGANEVEVLQRVLRAEVPKPSRQIAGYPAELEDVVLRMLQRDPADRYPTLGDAVDALRSYLESVSRAGDERAVADFVAGLVGEEVAEQVREVTPAAANFVIPLRQQPATGPSTSGLLTVLEKPSASSDDGPPTGSRGHATVVGAPLGADGPATVVTPPLHKRRRRSGMVAALAVVAVGAAGGALYVASTGETAPSPERVPDPAPTTTTTKPAPEVTTRAAPPRIALPKRIRPEQGVGRLEVTEPKGAQVFIDDVLWRELVPTVVTGLGRGNHKIRVVLDGAAAESEVLVEDDGAATLVLSSEPPGAAVWQGDTLLGATPLEVASLAARESHRLRIEKPGYDRMNVDVELAPGERKEMSVTLTTASKAAHNRAPARRVAREPAPSAPAPQPAGFGYFSVDTTPWAKVYVDGSPRGSTPIVRMKLPAGPHTIRLVNEGAGVDTTRAIQVSAGETLKRKWQLE